MEFPQRQRYWDELNTLFSKSTMTDENRTKINSFLYSKKTRYTTRTRIMCVAPCYVSSWTLMNIGDVKYKSHSKTPSRMERLFLEVVKTEPLYQNLYTSGAFDSMELRSGGNLPGDQLSDAQKELCIRASKMVRISVVHLPWAWEFEKYQV